MISKASLLKLLLHLGGVVTNLAFPAMLLPVDWMAETHRLPGLGELPRSPVVDYLARSIAALYGFHGVLLLLIAADIRKYRAIVLYAGAMNALFGAMMLAIDLHAGMPAFWTATEGPPLVAFGLVILYLARAALYR